MKKIGVTTITRIILNIEFLTILFNYKYFFLRNYIKNDNFFIDGFAFLY